MSHPEPSSSARDDRETFGLWLIRQDPTLGWPVLAWLLWTLCLGMILGWILT